MRHIGVIRQQLFRVLRKAVAAVTETRIVVVAANTRVQAHALDNRLRVQSLDLRVGVQLVEVAHPKGEIGVREEFHRLRFFHAHKQRRDVFLDRAFLQQVRECLGSSFQFRQVRDLPDGLVLLLELCVPDNLRQADDDPTRVEVVVQRFALTQELRGEQQVEPLHAFRGVFRVQAAAVPHRDRRLDHHNSRRVHFQHQVNHFLHVARVEEVLLAVVVRRGGDHHEVRVPVGRLSVKRRRQVQVLFREVFLDLFVLDWGDSVINLFDLLGDDVHGNYFVVLRQQRCDAQSHISRACYCYFHNSLF